MYSQRPNIDLESMLDKAPTPNRLRAPSNLPFNIAPIRNFPAHMLPNKQNIVLQTNQRGVNRNFEDSKNFGMGKIVEMPKKPLISPVRNPFKTQIKTMNGEQQGAEQFNKQPILQENKNCVNHPNKSAEFNIDIEDECLSYCGRCAAQLASQGFQVNKIQSSNVTRTVKKNESRNHVGYSNSQSNNNLPRYPEYEGNHMYETILQFLSELSDVQNKHSENMGKFSEVDNHYNQQIEETKHFYSELLSFVQQMKDDHLNDLYEESRKHSQEADIQNDYLRENVDELIKIRNDIEQNLETIVDKLEEEDLTNNLNYYKQKVQGYRHQVEDQTEFFDSFINFTPQEYGSKLERVQDFLMEVWNNQGETQQSHQQDKFTHNYLHQNQQNQQRPQRQTEFQKIVNQSNQQQYQLPQQNLNMQNIKKAPFIGVPENDGQQPAFRKLFEEEEPIMAETSPQFKKI